MIADSLARPDAMLRYDSTGRGPDVLLLHAGGEDRRVWHPVMERLAVCGLSATAYDQRAHGESGGDRGQPVTYHGEDTAAMLARLTVPVVVGASLGGFAALLALADPEVEANTAGLVLVDVVPDPDPERTRRFLASRGMDQLPLVNDILGRRDALREIAARLGLPVLAVRAGKREPLSDDDAVRFRTLVPHASVVTVSGAGHLVARDQPERLALALGDFVGSDAVRDRRISRFVALAGGAAIAHPGGTLEQHLHRTAATLRAWGAPSVLVDAGRLHAAYGTDGFARALVGDLDRRVIEKIVGLAAEQLIWQYGRCDRARSYPTWHTSTPQLFDRSTGAAADLTDEQRAMLVELTVANELDVLARDPELARLHGASLRQLFARWAAFVSAGARAAVAAMPC